MRRFEIFPTGYRFTIVDTKGELPNEVVGDWKSAKKKRTRLENLYAEPPVEEGSEEDNG